jgi:hypothetical protein
MLLIKHCDCETQRTNRKRKNEEKNECRRLCGVSGKKISTKRNLKGLTLEAVVEIEVILE